MEAQGSSCLHAGSLCTQRGHNARDWGPPGLKGSGRLGVSDTHRPQGQKLSVGCAWSFGLGVPPPGLSLHLPPPQSTWLHWDGGGGQGIEDEGTASNCCDLKSKEEELGAS